MTVLCGTSSWVKPNAHQCLCLCMQHITCQSVHNSTSCRPCLTHLIAPAHLPHPSPRFPPLFDTNEAPHTIGIPQLIIPSAQQIAHVPWLVPSSGRTANMSRALECVWRLHWWRRPHGRAFEMVRGRCLLYVALDVRTLRSVIYCGRSCAVAACRASVRCTFCLSNGSTWFAH